MNILEIISKKQEGLELSLDELKFVVDGYTNGDIPDYQMSAFLMAVYFKGATEEEATNLALVMRDSGDILQLGDVAGFKVDKHSTGGVGDKTTLVLGPMLAACGITFAKMSGRGLGHTGGTIDKLEAIPGFKTSLEIKEFKDNLNNAGIAITGQTGNLAPADKKIYALRDVTSTVASIPLIAASIMSKKLAIGTNAIMLDVKCGEGAFMKDLDQAKELAKTMVKIGKKAGRTVSAIITDMNTPLGCAVGNSLEVIEAIETLKGFGPRDLEDLCSTIAAYLIMDSFKERDFDKAYKMANDTLHDLSAFKKFVELVELQGGDKSYVYDTDKFERAKNVRYLVAEEEGYISSINALNIGEAVCALGAGREKLGEEIDYSVGIVIKKKVGDHVLDGDAVAEIYYNDKGFDKAVGLLCKSFTISKDKVETKLILDVIR